MRILIHDKAKMTSFTDNYCPDTFENLNLTFKWCWITYSDFVLFNWNSAAVT